MKSFSNEIIFKINAVVLKSSLTKAFLYKQAYNNAEQDIEGRKEREKLCYNTNVGGGGGSGHIGSGVTGSTIAGNTSFTDYDGTTVTGHAGNGYARITFVSAN
jgi:hypothetical protein